MGTPSYLPRNRRSTQVMEKTEGNYRTPIHRLYPVYNKGEGGKQMWAAAELWGCSQQGVGEEPFPRPAL